MKRENEILICEDETNISQMLKEVLEKQGYGCTQAFSWTEAVLCCKMKAFDLVLLDLMLPGMTGEEDMDVSRVFDRFYKADAARQKTTTGLGLCIAKELVERMHGRITAEKNDGTFLLRLYFYREMP